jgi:hypothetical protein
LPAGSLAAMPHLVRPTTLVGESFIEAARDFRSEGWLPEFPVEEVAADFAGYVRRVLADQQSQGVPASTLWYIDGVTYLGTVIIRHRLTPRLTRRGGQIGYQVAPPPPAARARHRNAGSGACLLPRHLRGDPRLADLCGIQHSVPAGHRSQRRGAGKYP